MDDPQPSSTTVFAPAKINLFLHITGKRNDGYHLLESLISFADIGDYVTITLSKTPKLEITGPFAASFNETELDNSPHSKNIIIKSLWGLSRLYKRAPSYHIHLQKNLPLAAGIGGGSADAAALIWAIIKEWGPPDDQDAFNEFMLSLGADVPVCYTCDNAFIRGIGENITPIQNFIEMPVVVINPLKPCATNAVFKTYCGSYQQPVHVPNYTSLDEFTDFLKKQNNDLEKPACMVVEDITNVLNALRYTNGCKLARMSGSGATCFGIFNSVEESHQAEQSMRQENPDWWIKSTILGGTVRY